ncbi:hypothetical protein RUND412_009535 [Rhizina undulata]
MSHFLQFAAFMAVLSACFELPSSHCYPVNLSITLVAVFVVWFGYFADLEVKSLTEQLEETKRRVQDLELTVRQATNPGIEIRASEDDIQTHAMQRYIEKLEYMGLFLKVSEEIRNNGKLRAQHTLRAAQYEEEIEILMDQDELQQTYIRELQTTAAQIKKNMKNFIFSQAYAPDSQPLQHRKTIDTTSRKHIGFSEAVQVFVFDNRLPAIEIKRFWRSGDRKSH